MISILSTKGIILSALSGFEVMYHQNSSKPNAINDRFLLCSAYIAIKFWLWQRFRLQLHGSEMSFKEAVEWKMQNSSAKGNFHDFLGQLKWHFHALYVIISQRLACMFLWEYQNNGSLGWEFFFEKHLKTTIECI